MNIPRMQCTGCGSCAAACPYNCIEMSADREGFLYPNVDLIRCVDCGLCQAACPVLTAPKIGGKPAALAAKHRDQAIREKSSSGGVFSALAEAVLEKGGLVCAAAYDTDFQVTHQIISDSKALAGLRGAKYAQSRPEHCYKPLEAALKRGQPVLFVGTPCQCAGLKAFLKKDYSQLLTVDMICHGVPSPAVWQRYLQELGSVRRIDLRNKRSGWSRYNYSVEVEFSDGSRKLTPQGSDPYLRGFVQNLYLRPACSSCRYKGLQRCSDITLGDFWGIWDLAPEFDDDRGTSLVLFHTEKGTQIWQQVQSAFDTLSFAPEAAIAQNPSAVSSSPAHPRREAFFEAIEKKTVTEAIAQCLALRQNKRSFLRRILRKE